MSNNLKKWLCFAGFVIMALISCWATEHSFHLLVDFIPEPFVWALTIGFFVLASYGTKMIVDSLNHDLLLDNPRRTFWLGFTLVALFWLFMSMPTNTHTFFYNHKIGDVVQEDFLVTRGYLEQIKERNNYDPKYDTVHTQVNELFNELVDEYNGIGKSGKKGGGVIVNQYLRQINTILEGELPGTAIPENTDAWDKFSPQVRADYERKMNESLERIKDEKYKVTRQAAKEATECIRQIDMMMDTVKAQVQAGNLREDVIKQSEGVLSTSYTCVKNNAAFVKLQVPEDQELYTAENLETRTKRMLSVIDVWIDFLHGEYPLSFVFYVLLSILVDLGAFLFFDLTFKKES